MAGREQTELSFTLTFPNILICISRTSCQSLCLDAKACICVSKLLFATWLRARILFVCSWGRATGRKHAGAYKQARYMDAGMLVVRPGTMTMARRDMGRKTD